KMPRATRRINDGEAEQLLDRVSRVLGDGVGDDGLESAVEQHLHEAVGRVVAAGRLARVALGFASGGEGELPPILCDLRNELEKTLVDRAQLLGSHVAPVDAREAAVFAQPGELEHGKEQRAV